MVQPLVHLNKRDWCDLLERFNIELLASCKEKGIEECKAKNIHESYASVLDREQENIITVTGADIQKYINRYAVDPSGGICDEFKNIYFLGSSVARFLERDGLQYIVELHLLIMLRMLNLRLHSPYNAIRKPLTDRVIRAIKDKLLSNDFGDYGLYVTYKCLFNAAHAQTHKTAKEIL